MFLRNKNTGEVIEWDKNLTYKLDREYTSLKELCENYEDCEAPKLESWDAGIIEAECGIEVADKDYYEVLPDGTKKIHFTWDEAMAIEKKLDGKWRLPTIVEWTKLACEFGGKDGDFDAQRLLQGLQLSLGGVAYNYSNGSLSYVGSLGYYWSSTVYNASRAYNLYFDSSYVYPQDYSNKGYGFSVRLVKTEGQ